MKKSLFALAATTAFVGAAQAQSSVTVYGILDVGLVGSNYSQMNTGAATTNYTKASDMSNGTLKGNNFLFGQSAEQTSRLGFKGTEDLGGGSSTFFTVEFGLSPNEQTLSGNTAGGLKNRQTFVGLKKNGIGSASIGTQYQPIHVAVGKTDPGQQNNMTGSVIYTGQADSGVLGSVGSNQMAYQSRFSNSLALDSDVLAGFQGHAFFVANSSNSEALSNVNAGLVATGGTTQTAGWSLGLDYTWNKLFLTGNYSAMKQQTSTINTQPTTTGAALSQLFNASASSGPAGACTATAANGLSVTGQACNVQDNTSYVGATYDFGILKAYASWISRKATDTNNSAWYQKRQAEQIGVRSFVTPTIEAWASAGVGTFTPAGFNQTSAHFNAWQLGSNYWLSKRTNLYAIYGATAQANSTYNTYTAAGAATGTYQTNLNAASYALGVRHTF